MKLTTKTLFIAVLFLVMDSNSFANEKNYSVRISPVVLFLTSIDIEADKKLSKKLSAGPMFTYFNYEAQGDRLNMVGFGARINYHFNEVFADSFFVSSYLKYWRYDITNDAIIGGTFRGEVKAAKLGFIAGYQWNWQRINMNLGASYALSGLDEITLTNANGTSRTYTQDDSFFITNLFLEWTLGMVF